MTEEVEIAMQGELLTHLRFIDREFGIDIHSVVGVGGFGWPREPRGEETRRRKGKNIARVEGESRNLST